MTMFLLFNVVCCCFFFFLIFSYTMRKVEKKRFSLSKMTRCKNKNKKSLELDLSLEWTWALWFMILNAQQIVYEFKIPVAYFLIKNTLCDNGPFLIKKWVCTEGENCFVYWFWFFLNEFKLLFWRNHMKFE